MPRSRAPKQPEEPKSHSRWKTMHYKRAVFVGGSTGGLSLKQLLDTSLSRVQKDAERMQRPDPKVPEGIRLITECNSLGTMLCGHFLDYTDGGGQLILHVDSSGALRIDELAPAKQQQFLEGMLYFGIRDNHVLLVQSKGLRSKQLESYLNWLLTTANMMPDKVQLFLEDAPPRQTRTKLDVDSIELTVPVKVSDLVGTPADSQGTLHSFVSALRQIAEFAGTPIGRLDPSEATKLPDIDLSLRVSRQGRGKRRYGPSLVDHIAHTLRNADDVDFVLKTTNGVEVTSDSLKLKQAKAFESSSKGRLVMKSLAQDMQAFLSDLIAQRHID